MQRRYFTVDVFTDEIFGGNPLAVVVDAEGLSSAQMQSIALEFNYSETTFILPPRNPANTAHVRIFTPRSEVPFAGHPNVGTAFVLARERQMSGIAAPDSFIFEEAAGWVPMTLLRKDGVIVGAELRAPEELSRRTAVSRESAAACLSLSPGEIAAARHPPQVVSVGLPFLVVELTSRAALSRAKPNLAAHEDTLPLDGADAVFAYVRATHEDSIDNDTVLHARMFSPLDGIVEDPATGSATAAAIALLASLAPSAPAERRWRVHQGVDMGRPSLLLGRTIRRDGGIAVFVAGHCVTVLEGTFVLERAMPK